MSKYLNNLRNGQDLCALDMNPPKAVKIALRTFEANIYAIQE
jgi:hypothetical protein